MRAVVLLSGGLDSTVCFSLAYRDYEEVMGVSVDYGQKHQRELQSAEDVCNYYGAPFMIVNLRDLYPTGSSVLTDSDAEVPHTSYKEITGVSPVYVPFRNALMLSVATVLAETHEAQAVYAGMHSEDARDWAYPDCTPEFIGGMSNAIWVGTYHRVRLITPLQWLTKHEIVRLGLDLGTPFNLTWSCYTGGNKACGECPTCQSRLEAFRINKVKDPIGYEGNRGERWD